MLSRWAARGEYPQMRVARGHSFRSRKKELLAAVGGEVTLSHCIEPCGVMISSGLLVPLLTANQLAKLVDHSGKTAVPGCALQNNRAVGADGFD